MNEDSRTGVQGVIPAEIRSLLDRRATIQEWLVKLDGLRDAYRPEVHSRVAGDYAERLQAVEGELGTHRAGLEETLAGRRAAADDLLATRDACAAELEEVELRHAVGEFAADEFEERKGGHEETLADLGTRIDAERAAIDELEGALSQIGGGASRPEGMEEDATTGVGMPEEFEDSPWTEEESEEQGSEEPSAEGAEPATLRSPGISLEAMPDVEEVAAEEEAAEETDAAEAVAKEAPAEEEPAGEAEITLADTGSDSEGDAAGEDHDEFMDELEFLESLSLDEPERFDAITQLLEGDEESNDSRGGAAAGDVDGG